MKAKDGARNIRAGEDSVLWPRLSAQCHRLRFRHGGRARADYPSLKVIPFPT